jgi:hypothetical protein
MKKYLRNLRSKFKIDNPALAFAERVTFFIFFFHLILQSHQQRYGTAHSEKPNIPPARGNGFHFKVQESVLY